MFSETNTETPKSKAQSASQLPTGEPPAGPAQGNLNLSRMSLKGSRSSLRASVQSIPAWIGSSIPPGILTEPQAAMLRRLKVALLSAESMLKAYSKISAGPKLNEVLEKLTDIENEILSTYVDLTELRIKHLGVTLARAGTVLSKLALLIAELPSRGSMPSHAKDSTPAGSAAALTSPTALSSMEGEIQIYLQRLHPSRLPEVASMRSLKK